MMLFAQVSSNTWQIETNWTWAPWVTVIVIVGLVALVAWLYRTEVSPAGTGYRSLLALLRLVSLGIVLAMLSELVLSSTNVGDPRLEVLIDRSPSMAEADIDEEGTTRFGAAKQFLLEGEESPVAQLAARYDLNITAVGNELLPLAGDDESLALQLESLQLDPAESLTRLGDAIASAASPRSSSSPAAIVAFTDGRTTLGRSTQQAAAIARRRGVPLLIVGLGTTTLPADVAIEDVVFDPVVFADDLATVRGSVQWTGDSDAPVSVKLINSDTGETLAEQQLKLDEQGAAEVSLVFEPQESGVLPLKLAVDTLPDEEDATNNERTFSLRVTDEPVRVLLAAGYPSYEFRFLKSVLDRDSKFETATYLQEADIDYARQDRTAIAQLPLSIEQYAKFDVVVLMDLDPKFLPPLVWENLEKMVGQRGGGLMLVAGPRHYPQAFSDNEMIARLSPVDITTSEATGGSVDDGYRLEWTELANQFANVQLASERAESDEIWTGLLPHYWYADSGPPKPAAQVVAVHPEQRTVSGSAVPLVAMQYYGAGRVWYHGFDDTWHWRLRVGDVFFARYWGQTLRMLARNKMISDASGVQLVVNRREFAPQEVVRLSLRTGSQAGASLALSEPMIALESLGATTRRIPLKRQASTGQFRADLRDLPPGRYRGLLVEPLLDPAPQAIEFSVVAPPGEMTDTTLNEAELQAAAAETFGKYYSLDEAANLLADLPVGEPIIRDAAPPIELWNRWWMLAALATCLSLEWILRKRKAML